MGWGKSEYELMTFCIHSVSDSKEYEGEDEEFARHIRPRLTRHVRSVDDELGTAEQQFKNRSRCV